MSWRRRLGVGGLLGVVVLGCAGLGAVGFVTTDTGKAWLLDLGLSAVQPWLLGELEVGALETDLWTTATLVDVRVATADGEVVSAGSVELSLDGWSLGRVRVDDFAAQLDGSQPGIFGVVAPEVLAMIPAQSFELEATGALDAAGVSVSELDIRGRAELEGVLRLEDLDVRGQVLAYPLAARGTAIFAGDRGSVDLSVDYREATASVAGSGVRTSAGVSLEGRYAFGAGPVALTGTATGVWPAVHLNTVSDGLQIATEVSLSEGSQRSEVELTDYTPPFALAAPVALSGQCRFEGALPTDDLRADGQCGLSVDAAGWSTGFDGTVAVRDLLLQVHGETTGGLGCHTVHGQLTPTSVRATTRGRVPLGVLGLSGGALPVETTVVGPLERLDVEATAPSSWVAVEGLEATAHGGASLVVEQGAVSGRLWGTANDVRGRGTEVAVVELRSSVTGAVERPSGQGTVVVGDVAVGDVVLRPEPIELGWRAGQGFLAARGEIRAPIETRGVEGLLEVAVRSRGRNIAVDGQAEALQTRARFSGAVDLERSVLELTALDLDRGGLGLVAPGRIRLEPDGPVIEELDLGQVRVDGSLESPQVTLVDLPVEGLRDWIPELPEVSGTVSGRLEVGPRGPSGHLTLEDLWRPGMGVVASVDDGVVEGTIEEGGRSLGWVRGQVPSTLDGPLSVRVRVDRASSEDLPELGLPVEAVASADVRVSGPLRALGMTGWASMHAAGVDTEVRFERVGDQLVANGLLRRDATPLARFDGGAELFVDDGVRAFLEGHAHEGPWVALPSGQLVMRGLPARTVAELAGLPLDVAGGLYGRALLTDGIPSGALRWREARIGEVDVPDAHVHWDEAVEATVEFVARADAHAQRGRRYRGDLAETRLSVRGRAPVHLDWTRGIVLDEVAELDIAGEVPVAVASALHPSIQDGVGAASVSGRVRLEPAALAPKVNAVATVALHDGALTARRLGLRADDIDLDAEIDGTDVVYRTAMRTRRWTNRGDRRARRPSIEASGRATLGWHGLHGLLGEVELENALVVGRRQQRAWVTTVEPLTFSGDIPRTGPWDSSVAVRGVLHVDRADVSLDKQTLMEAELWDGPPRVLDPRIVRLGQAPGQHREPDPFWSILDARIGLELGSDTHGSLDLAYFEQLGVLGTEASTIAMEGSLVGHVDLTVSGGVPHVEGQLDLSRGTARMVRSFFDLESGSITFVDGDPFQPFVDVEGSLELDGGGTVELGLRGTPSDARVSLSSGDLVSSDQVLAAVITRENPNTNSGAAAALSLGSALAEGVFFGGMDLGDFEIREGYLRYPLAFGPRLRVTPGLGLGTGFARDVVRMDLGYLASPRLGLHGVLGLSTARAGLVWRRRF